LSVRPFRHSPAAAVCGGFAAERRADRRYRSTAAAARRSAANASRVTFTAAADVEKMNTNLLSEKKTASRCFYSLKISQQVALLIAVLYDSDIPIFRRIFNR